MRAALAVLLLAGCGPAKSGPDAGERLRQPNLGGSHLSSCADPTCGNGMNPPLGGDHCPTWLPCRSYDTAQPRCNWIHNLEHGHAVLAWNCPSGCDALVAQLNALWQARQSDPTRRRILVTPDPQLPHRLAALVWGFGWQGDEFNAAAIEDVLAHQDQEAPEASLGCAP